MGRLLFNLLTLASFLIGVSLLLSPRMSTSAHFWITTIFGTYGPFPTSIEGSVNGVPFICLAVVLLRVVAHLVDKRKRESRCGNLCPKCGYDLRASKDRCPECGTPMAKAEATG